MQFAQAASSESFCAGWLAIQCGIIPDVAAAVLLLGPSDRGPFSPAAMWPAQTRDVRYLTASAERVLVERRGLVVRREPTGALPERFDIGYPVEVAGRLHGAVVLHVAPRPEPRLHEALRQLQWGFAWLEVLLRREEGAKEGLVRDRLQTVLDLVGTALDQDDFPAAATALVNALATRLACDRVSLGLVRNGRVHVRVVSRSAHFQGHATVMRLVGDAMDEALDQRAAIVYPVPGGSSRISRAHAELSRQQGGTAVCSVPLVARGQPLGVLTLERPAERAFDEATVELCETLGAVVAPILDGLRRDDRWLLAKAADSGRRLLARLVGPRHVALKLAVLGVVAVAMVLAFARGEYRVTARSTMEAAIRRAVVAPFNGYVVQAAARAGDLVRTGQVLCRLDDRDLRLEQLRWSSQLEQLSRQQNQALATRNAAQVSIIGAQLDQARSQLELVEEQLARTQVVAAFDGVVVLGDLSQSLGSPVERGQVLFEIAPLDAYRVVLHVDERDIADVSVGQRGRLVLAADPAAPVDFRVEKLTPVSIAREGHNYFRVEGRLDRLPEQVRPGMEGVGKIEAGRHRLLWIWLRPAIDWLRLTIWTWVP